MDPIKLLQNGRLTEARKTLVERIKKNPGDIGLRTVLFQVMAFCGEWEKAEKQLDAIAVQSQDSTPCLETYRDVLKAEQERCEVVALRAEPAFFPEKPEYYDTYRDAVVSLRNGEVEEAYDLYRQIDEGLENLSGILNGERFGVFSNPDSRLTYFLEIFAHGRHIYIPFEKIRELLIAPPENYFDLLWPQVTLTTFCGLSMNCFLPAVYPESHIYADDNVKMGRLTDWISVGGSFLKGVGQQVFDLGDREISLLEIRELHVDC